MKVNKIDMLLAGLIVSFILIGGIGYNQTKNTSMVLSEQGLLSVENVSFTNGSITDIATITVSNNTTTDIDLYISQSDVTLYGFQIVDIQVDGSTVVGETNSNTVTPNESVVVYISVNL